jgi:hypothetical protein
MMKNEGKALCNLPTNFEFLLTLFYARMERESEDRAKFSNRPLVLQFCLSQKIKLLAEVR